MTVPQCSECLHMKRDPKTGHMRCYSPQAEARRRAGIINVYERDNVWDGPGNAAEATRKCGTQGVNFIKREHLA